MGQIQSSTDEINDSTPELCKSAEMNWNTISELCDETYTQKKTPPGMCKLKVDPQLLNSICKLNFNNGEIYHLDFNKGKPRPCNL